MLETPANAVNDEVQLEITSLPTENAPAIPCDYGEFFLSDVVLIRPIGIQFRTAANLSIEHGITDLQELSAIVIKWYDNEKREWLPLPLLASRQYYDYHLQ